MQYFNEVIPDHALTQSRMQYNGSSTTARPKTCWCRNASMRHAWVHPMSTDVECILKPEYLETCRDMEVSWVLAWRLLHILGVGPKVSYPNAESASNDGQLLSATYCSIYIFTILLYKNWDSVVATQLTTNRPAYKLTRHWKQVSLKAKRDQNSVSISAESMFSVYSH